MTRGVAGREKHRRWIGDREEERFLDFDLIQDGEDVGSVSGQGLEIWRKGDFDAGSDSQFDRYADARIR